MDSADRMIDNAATASQNITLLDDEVTRESILLNIIMPMQTRIARLETALRQIRNDSACSQMSTLREIIDGTL